jgi:hypothetical protein
MPYFPNGTVNTLPKGSFDQIYKNHKLFALFFQVTTAQKEVTKVENYNEYQA